MSGGYTPGLPLKGERGEEREEAREGSPPIHIPGYATVKNSIVATSNSTVNMVFLSIMKMPNTLNPID